MHCRIDFMEMSVDRAALDRLADGLNQLWDAGVIQARATLHDSNFFNGIHWAPQFLPWHRYFLLLLEQDLQAIDSRIVLPYWDWTRADSGNLDAEPWKSFFGGRNNTGGRFDHWTYTRAPNDGGNSLPQLADIVAELENKANFTEYRVMECGSHVPGHTWTGGTMAGGESPLDPLFYLHHGNLDRLWAIWQRNNLGAPQYSTDGIACGSQFGVAAVPLNTPMIGGATPASMLDHLALGYRYPEDLPLEAAVAGNPNFPNFQSGDPAAITLQTPEIVFNDVPTGETTMRAAFFTVETCSTLSFEVESGPTGNFTLHEPGPFPFPAQGSQPTTEFRIWVLFTGGPAGSTDPGGVMTVVAHDGDGNEVGRWDDIPIIANSVQRPTAAVALVLDESGSMLSDAGNGRIRIDVLRDAAKTLVDQLYDDNALTLISFADAGAKLTDLTEAGPLNSLARQDARNEIDLHGPPSAAPLTSIGAGLQQAVAEFSTSPIAGNYMVQATVVFTDGFETRAPYIADVSQLLTDRVYAVGIADAENVQNDTLATLASGNDGFMLVMGALAQDDEFLLEKFFMQVLVGVTNQQMVRDPSGWLSLGSVERIPFSIVNSDIGFDTLALSRAPHYLATALQAPDGTVILPHELPAGSHRIGHNSNGFRVSLPVVKDGTGHWEGQWHLLMALRLKSHDVTHALRVARVGDVSGLGTQAALRYEALVHARSNLKLAVRVEQHSTIPGSSIFLHANLIEYGQPLRGAALVRAIVTEPDGSTATTTFARVGQGTYLAELVPLKAGAYRFRIVATGNSFRGAPFSREHLLSALVGRPSTGPSSGGDGDLTERLCRLIDCLGRRDVFGERFLKLLAEFGIDGREAAKCLREFCHRRDPSILRAVLKRRG